MKKISKILYVALFAMLVFCTQNIALASDIGVNDYIFSNDSYSFSNDETQIYLPFARFAKGNITVDKPINNMGVIFSNARIEVNESINKVSAIFAHDSIRVNSNVQNSALFAGSSIVIDSLIEGDVLLFAGSEITISENAVVEGDIICFTGTLNVKGTVKGSIIGAATRANITGVVEKDFRFEAKEINIENKDLIKGVFYVESDEALDDVKVLYPELINKIVEKEQEVKVDFVAKIKDFILSALVLTVLYVLLAKLQKKEFFKNQLDKVNKYKTPVILIGTLGFVAIPFVFVIGIILAVIGLSAITVPVMFVYLALIVSAAMLGVFVAGGTIITIINEKYLKEKNIIYLMLVSFGIFLALHFVTLIPMVGIVFAMYALGVLTVAIVKKSETKV